MLERVKDIAEVLNLGALSFTEIAKGATSRVYLLETANKNLVVRLAEPNPGKEQHKALFEADAGIRLELLKRDKRTVMPVASSGEHPEITNTAWSIDEYVSGDSPKRGQIDPSICLDIGQVLRALHDIPVTNYGRLKSQKQPLTGRFTVLEQGVQSRFQDPWPFTGKSLVEHPIAEVDVELVKKIELLQKDIFNAAIAETYSIVHVDLHEKQFITQNNRLKAIIDFGDAMVAAAAWDFASFRYFHGLELTNQLLEGYCETASEGQELLEKSRLLSVTIALHHISRSFTLKRSSRKAFAHAYLKSLAL